MNGEPFDIKGVNYGPAPIGVNSATMAPFGDYFTPEYSALWQRDFPLIHALGANTVRVAAWNASLDADHTPFLDMLAKVRDCAWLLANLIRVSQHELKALVTFWSGAERFHPVGTAEQRQALVDSFANNARKYAGHPALLGWVFGNELNALWTNYLQQFAAASNCNWNAAVGPRSLWVDD